MQKYITLLRRNPEFTKLWSAQVISLMGDWFNTIVLSALVIKYSPENQGLAIGLFLVSRFIPPAIISPFAGVLVDRFNRKWLLVWSNWLRAIIVAGFLLVIGNPELLWAIYALTILQFMLSAVFEPGQSAIIPTLVRRDDLIEANTLAGVMWSVMLAVGAVLGGAVTAIFGSETALLIDVITFIISGAIIASIVYKPSPRKTHDEHGNKYDTSMGEGIRFLRRNPHIASALLVKSGGSIGNLDALMTIFATQLFVIGADGEISLGIMYSAFGVGALVGPLIINRLHSGSTQSMRRMITYGFAIMGLSWIVLGVAGVIGVICVGITMRAVGGSFNWIYSTIIIQRTTPDEYLGRVFSLDMMGFYIVTVISILAHSLLIDYFGTENAQTIALLTSFVSIAPLMVWVWVIRWLDAHSPETTPIPATGD